MSKLCLLPCFSSPLHYFCWIPQVLACCVFIFICFYAYFDFLFDFFHDLLVIQKRVIWPPYVCIFNSFFFSSCSWHLILPLTSNLTCVHWVCNAIQPSHPFTPSSALSVFQDQGLSGSQIIGASPSASVLMIIQWIFIGWISVSFRTDWFDNPAIYGTPNGLLQHHNSKASILLQSAFFIVQFSYLYISNGEGNSTLLQYSCLENPMDGGAW